MSILQSIVSGVVAPFFKAISDYLERRVQRADQITLGQQRQKLKELENAQTADRFADAAALNVARSDRALRRLHELTTRNRDSRPGRQLFRQPGSSSDPG